MRVCVLLLSKTKQCNLFVKMHGGKIGVKIWHDRNYDIWVSSKRINLIHALSVKNRWLIYDCGKCFTSFKYYVNDKFCKDNLKLNWWCIQGS